MKEKRRFAALLAAAALAVNLAAVPVLATETAEPGSPLTGVVQPDPPEESLPNPDPPPEQSSSSPSSESSSSSQPPEESSSTPSSESSASSESSSSSEGSSSEESWGSSQEPSSEEPEDPSSSWGEPSEEPSGTESQWESQSSQQGSGVQAPTYNEPETIATPRPAVERPSVSLNTGSSSSQAEEDSGPNYVTFATLNVRGNSMAATLFYSGLGFIAVGVLGLVTVLVLYIRGRRRYAATEQILEEIHQAETRQRPGPAAASQEFDRPAAPMAPPAPAPYASSPNALVPEEASLYTEEFALPPQDQAYDPYEDGAYQEEDYGESYGQSYGQDGYYDDYEDYGPYQEEGYQEGDGCQEPAYEPQPPARQAAPPPAAPAPDLGATRQFDTEEILREALRYTDEDYREDNYDSYQ